MTDRHRKFEITKDVSGQTAEITIGEPSLKLTDLALSTWSASTVLANLLHKIDVSFETVVNGAGNGHSLKIDVLELGAGTGLVGIASAVIWQARVALTDLPGALRNLTTNVELNASTLRTSGGSAIAGVLDWAKPETLMLRDAVDVKAQQYSKARVILASDTVYSEELPKRFVNVVNSWLERSGDARLIIAYPLRFGALDHIRDLWNRLEDAGLIALDESKEEVGEEWDDERLIEWSVWKWIDPSEP